MTLLDYVIANWSLIVIAVLVLLLIIAKHRLNSKSTELEKAEQKHQDSEMKLAMERDELKQSNKELSSNVVTLCEENEDLELKMQRRNKEFEKMMRGNLTAMPYLAGMIAVF